MTPDRPVTVFVTIANIDDRLTPHVWARFHSEIAEMMQRAGAIFQGEWFCGPTALRQSACWCVAVQPGIAERLKGELAAIGAVYGRGMVGWSEVSHSAILG